MSNPNANRTADVPSHVSLFPMPPWQLIRKYTENAVAQNTAPLPPPPPTSAYQAFGIPFNPEDPMLRSLEAQGIRRVYPQSYNRKMELKKLNFSILANYLDLLDIITRDPSSPKRIEKLDHLRTLFINMHHLVNEYRPHQARDLLREVMAYQGKVAAETVRRGVQYLASADNFLHTAARDLATQGLPPPESHTNIASFDDLGPELSDFLIDLQKKIPANVPFASTVDHLNNQLSELPPSPSLDNLDGDQLESCVWNFLNEGCE